MFNFDPSYNKEVNEYINHSFKYRFFRKVYLLIIAIMIFTFTVLTFSPNTFAKANELSDGWSNLLGNGNKVNENSTLANNTQENGLNTTSLSKDGTTDGYYYAEDGTAYKLLYYTWKTAKGDAVTDENGNNIIGIYAPVNSIYFNDLQNGTNYYNDGKTYSYYSLYDYATDYKSNGTYKYIPVSDAENSDGKIQDSFYAFLNENGYLTDDEYNNVSTNAYYQYLNQNGSSDISDIIKYYNVYPVSSIKVAYVYRDGSYQYGTPYTSDYDTGNGTIYANKQYYELEVAGPSAVDYFENENGKIYINSAEWNAKNYTIYNNTKYYLTFDEETNNYYFFDDNDVKHNSFIENDKYYFNNENSEKVEMNNDYKTSYYSNGLLKIWYDEENLFYSFSIKDLLTLNYLSQDEYDDLTQDISGGNNFVTYDSLNGLIVKIKRELKLIQTTYKLAKEENTQIVYVTEDDDLSPTINNDKYIYYTNIQSTPSYYRITCDYAFNYYAEEVQNLFKFKLNEVLYNYDENIETYNYETKIELDEAESQVSTKYFTENNREFLLLSDKTSLKENSLYAIITNKLDEYCYLNNTNEVISTISYYDLTNLSSTAKDATILLDSNINGKNTIYKNGDNFYNDLYYNYNSSNYQNKDEVTIQQYNFNNLGIEKFNLTKSYSSNDYGVLNSYKLNEKLRQKDSVNSTYYSEDAKYYSYNENNGSYIEQITQSSPLASSLTNQNDIVNQYYYELKDWTANYTLKIQEQWFVVRFKTKGKWINLAFNSDFIRDNYYSIETLLISFYSKNIVKSNKKNFSFTNDEYETFFEFRNHKPDNTTSKNGFTVSYPSIELYTKNGIYAYIGDDYTDLDNYSPSGLYIGTAHNYKGWWAWEDWENNSSFKVDNLDYDLKAIQTTNYYNNEERITEDSSSNSYYNFRYSWMDDDDEFTLVTTTTKHIEKYSYYYDKYKKVKKYLNYNVATESVNLSIADYDHYYDYVNVSNNQENNNTFAKLWNLIKIANKNKGILYYYNNTWYTLQNNRYIAITDNLLKPSELDNYKFNGNSFNDNVIFQAMETITDEDDYSWFEDQNFGYRFKFNYTVSEKSNVYKYSTLLNPITKNEHVILDLNKTCISNQQIITSNQFEELKNEIIKQFKDKFDDVEVTIEEIDAGYSCNNGENLIKKFTFTINDNISYTLVLNRGYQVHLYRAYVNEENRNVINFDNLISLNTTHIESQKSVPDAKATTVNLAEEQNNNNICFTNDNTLVDLTNSYTINTTKTYNKYYYNNISTTKGNTIEIYNIIPSSEVNNLTDEEILNTVVKDENTYIGSTDNVNFYLNNFKKYSNDPTNENYLKESYLLDETFYEDCGIFGNKVNIKYTYEIPVEDYDTFEFESDENILNVLKSQYGNDVKIYEGENNNSFQFRNSQIVGFESYYQAIKNIITYKKVADTISTINHGETTNEISSVNNSAIYGFYKNAYVNIDGSFGYDTNSFEEYSLERKTFDSKNKINLFDQNEWFLKYNNQKLIKSCDEANIFKFLALDNTTIDLYFNVSSNNYYICGYNLNGTYYSTRYNSGDVISINVNKNETITLSEIYLMLEENYNKDLENNYVSYVNIVENTSDYTEKFRQTYLEQSVIYYKYSEVKDLPEFEAYNNFSKEIETKITGYKNEESISNETDLILYSNNYDVNFGSILYTLSYQKDDTWYKLIDNQTYSEVDDIIYGKIDNLLFRYTLTKTEENLYFETERSYIVTYNKSISSYIDSTTNDIDDIKNGSKKAIENPTNYDNLITDTNGYYYSLDSNYGKYLALENFINNNKHDVVIKDENGDNITRSVDYAYLYNSANNQFYFINNMIDGTTTEYIKYTVNTDVNKDTKNIVTYIYNGVEYKTYAKLDTAYYSQISLYQGTDLSEYFDDTTLISQYFNQGYSKENIDTFNTLGYSLRYEYNDETNKYEFILTDTAGTPLQIASNTKTFGYSFLIPDAMYDEINETCNSKYRLKLNENGIVFTQYGLYQDQGYFVEGIRVENQEEANQYVGEGYYFPVVVNNSYSLQTENQKINSLYSDGKYAYTETDQMLYLDTEGNWTHDSETTKYRTIQVRDADKEVLDHTEMHYYIKRVTGYVDEVIKSAFLYVEHQETPIFSDEWEEVTKEEYDSYVVTCSTWKVYWFTTSAKTTKTYTPFTKYKKFEITSIYTYIPQYHNELEEYKIENISLTKVKELINLSSNNNVIEYNGYIYKIKDLLLIMEDDIQVYKLYTSTINNITIADSTDTDIIDLTQWNANENIPQDSTYRLRWDGNTQPRHDEYMSYYANSTFNLFDEEVNQYVYSNGDIYYLKKIFYEDEFYEESEIYNSLKNYIIKFKNDPNKSEKIDWDTMMYASFYGNQVNTETNGFINFCKTVASALKHLFSFGNADDENDQTHPIGYYDDGSDWFSDSMVTDSVANLTSQMYELYGSNYAFSIDELIKIYIYLNNNSIYEKADLIYSKYNDYKNASDKDAYINSNFNDAYKADVKKLYDLLIFLETLYKYDKLDRDSFIALLYITNQTRYFFFEKKNTSESSIDEYLQENFQKFATYILLNIFTLSSENQENFNTYIYKRFVSINNSNLSEEDKVFLKNILSVFMNNYMFKKSTLGFNYQQEFTVEYYKTLLKNWKSPNDSSINWELLNEMFGITENKYELDKISNAINYVINHTDYASNNTDNLSILIMNNDNAKLIYHKVKNLSANKVVQKYYRTDDGFAFNEYYTETANDESELRKDLSLKQVFEGLGHLIIKYDITENIMNTIMNEQPYSKESNDMKMGSYYFETWLTSPEYLHAYNFTKLMDKDNYLMITNYNVNASNYYVKVQSKDNENKDFDVDDINTYYNPTNANNIYIDDFYLNGYYQSGNIHPIGMSVYQKYTYNDIFKNLNNYSSILNQEGIDTIVLMQELKYQLCNFEDEQRYFISESFNGELNIENYKDKYFYINEQGKYVNIGETYKTMSDLYTDIVAGKIYKENPQAQNDSDTTFYNYLPKTKIYYYTYNTKPLSTTNTNVVVCAISSVLAGGESINYNSDGSLKTWYNNTKWNDDYNSKKWNDGPNSFEQFFGNGYYIHNFSYIEVTTKYAGTTIYEIPVSFITGTESGLSTSSIISAKSKYYDDITRINATINYGDCYKFEDGTILSGESVYWNNYFVTTIGNEISEYKTDEQFISDIYFDDYNGTKIYSPKTKVSESVLIENLNSSSLVFVSKADAYNKSLILCEWNKTDHLATDSIKFTQDEIEYTIKSINLYGNTPTVYQKNNRYSYNGKGVLVFDATVKSSVVKGYFAIVEYEENDEKKEAFVLLKATTDDTLDTLYNTEIYQNYQNSYDGTKYTTFNLMGKITLDNIEILEKIEITKSYYYVNENGKTVMCQPNLFTEEKLGTLTTSAPTFKYVISDSSKVRSLIIDPNVYTDENGQEYYKFEYNGQTYESNGNIYIKSDKNKNKSIILNDFLNEQYFSSNNGITLQYYNRNGKRITLDTFSGSTSVEKVALQTFKYKAQIGTDQSTFEKYIYGYSPITSEYVKGNKISINGEYNCNASDAVMEINVNAKEIKNSDQKITVNDTTKFTDTDYKEEKTSFELTIKTSDKYNEPFYYVLSFTANYDLWQTPAGYIAKVQDGETIYYYDGTDEANKTISNAKVSNLQSVCKTKNINSSTYLFKQENMKNVIYNLNYNFEANEIKISSLVSSANYSLKIYNIFGQFIKEIEFTTGEDLTYNPYGKFFDEIENPENYLTLNKNNNSDEILLANEYIPSSLKQLLFSKGNEAKKIYVKTDGTEYNISDKYRLKMEETISNIEKINLKFLFSGSDTVSNHNIRLEYNGKTYDSKNDIISINYSDIQSILNKYNSDNNVFIDNKELENFIEQELIVKGKITSQSAPAKDKNVSILGYITYTSNFLYLDLDQSRTLTTKMETEFINKNNFKNFDGYNVPNENSVKFVLGTKIGNFEIVKDDLELDGEKVVCYMPKAIGDTINKYTDGFVFVENKSATTSYKYRLYAYSNKEQGKIVQ